MIVPLVRALQRGRDLSSVPGVFYRHADGAVACNASPPRICDLDAIPRPAYHQLDLRTYDAFGMISSRGCPYRCTFCSVAPVWNNRSYFRSAEDVVAEMCEVYERAGVDLVLFQDEFFVSSKKAVMRFCETLRRTGRPLRWKAFARVDLADEELMRAMASSGCVEIRFGIESGSARMLKSTRKGFSPERAVEVVSLATRLFSRTDTFFIWGYPDETMDDFYQSLFQMVAFRMMGAHILPSLLCLLPQTELFAALTEEQKDRLELCEDLLPEYVVTGHEVCKVGTIEVTPKQRVFFDFIRAHRELFPGFFLLDADANIRPKLAALQAHGFYLRPDRELAAEASVGAVV